jgi:hypothetical protein
MSIGAVKKVYGLSYQRCEASMTIDGERKTVTTLFVNIKGSTELMEDIDREEVRSIYRSGAEADEPRRPSISTSFHYASTIRNNEIIFIALNKTYSRGKSELNALRSQYVSKEAAKGAIESRREDARRRRAATAGTRSH